MSANNSGASLRQPNTRLLRVLGLSRYSVGIAVVGTFAAATALLVHGAVEVFQLVVALFKAGGSHGADGAAASPMLLGIAAVKTFLVAIMFYVIAIGFYQLFFHRLPLPAWLVVEDLAELELKLIEVVISTLGVVFMGQVVTWNGQRDLQGFGIGTAMVIAALAYAISRIAPHATAERADAVARNDFKTQSQPDVNDLVRRIS